MARRSERGRSKSVVPYRSLGLALTCTARPRPGSRFSLRPAGRWRAGLPGGERGRTLRGGADPAVGLAARGRRSERWRFPQPSDTVAVVGNGLIGHGMAQIFAAAGRDVVLIGRREESLAAAMEKIGREPRGLRAARAHRRGGGRGGDRPHPDLDRPRGRGRRPARPGSGARRPGNPGRGLRGARSDLRAARRHRLGERTAGERPRLERPSPGPGDRGPLLVSASAHPLVEVCAGPETDSDVAPWLCDALRSAGKEPVIVDREIPGFLGNRLQYAILREAWALWSEGVASAEAIDTVVKASIGRRLAITGPIESADAGGLDTLHAFGAYLIPHLRTGAQPAQAVTDLVEAGHRGLPSGRGVYDWSGRDGAALLAEREAEPLPPPRPRPGEARRLTAGIP